ncbi:hypothetical protein MKW92_034054, partial [Papaver armeniacum]
MYSILIRFTLLLGVSRLETLKRVAPHRPEEFHAVESIARRFEGNVYNSATSQ